MSSPKTRPSLGSSSSSSSSLASNATIRSASSSISSNSSSSSTTLYLIKEIDNTLNSPTYNHKLLPRHLQDPMTRDYPLENPNKPLDIEECLGRKPLAHTFGAILESRTREPEREDLAEKGEKERRVREERREDLERVKAELRARAKYPLTFSRQF